MSHHFDFPEGITEIVSPYDSDDDCEDSWWGVDKEIVETVTIPDTVVIMIYCSFKGCRSLRTTTVPRGVRTIGIHAFQGCSSLTSVTIPDRVANIGIHAFQGCSSLTSVTIPDRVINIGEGAFAGCSSLVTLLFKPVTAATDTEQLNARALKQLPLTNLSRIWGSDHIINLLSGPFSDYTKFSEVPRAMRIAPDATTWAEVQLWLWWSDPQSDACDGRVLDRKRQQMVWTLMLVTLRLDTTSSSSEPSYVLPLEMWMMIITFVKHEEGT